MLVGFQTAEVPFLGEGSVSERVVTDMEEGLYSMISFKKEELKPPKM